MILAGTHWSADGDPWLQLLFHLGLNAKGVVDVVGREGRHPGGVQSAGPQQGKNGTQGMVEEGHQVHSQQRPGPAPAGQQPVQQPIQQPVQQSTTATSPSLTTPDPCE